MLHLPRFPAPALLLLVLGSCGTSPTPEASTPVAGTDVPPDAERGASPQPVPRGVVGYRGPLPPADPPGEGMGTDAARAAWLPEVLDMLYERPSGRAPAAIARPEPRAVFAEATGAPLRVLPATMPFIDSVPAMMRTALPPRGPFSDRVERTRAGSVRLLAVDRTLNDTPASRDSMQVEVRFTDSDSSEWRIVQAGLASLSPNPVGEPWLGGVAAGVEYHGTSGRGTAAMPRVWCEMCSWGWADVWRDGARIASGVPLHLMVTSATRGEPGAGGTYTCYDCTENPVRELHLMIPPSAGLPTPGGFLHLLWPEADVREDRPAALTASTEPVGEPWPVIRLRAVPYLEWSDTVIQVEAGQRYTLILDNQDPTAHHVFHLHGGGEGHGHEGGGQEGQARQEQQAGHEHGGHGRGEGSRSERPAHGLPAFEGEIRVPLPPGPPWMTTLEFSEPGSYHFGCPVENHEARGMRGRFVVSAAPRSGAGR